MEEIEFFKQQLALLRNLENKEYYKTDLDIVLNENNKELVFYQTEFKNLKYNKTVIIQYNPTLKKMSSGQIEIIFSYKGRSFNLSTFLAYSQYNRRISETDKNDFKFRVIRPNWKESLNQNLSAINVIIDSKCSQILESFDWINIPTVDPRDKY